MLGIERLVAGPLVAHWLEVWGPEALGGLLGGIVGALVGVGAAFILQIKAGKSLIRYEQEEAERAARRIENYRKRVEARETVIAPLLPLFEAPDYPCFIGSEFPTYSAERTLGLPDAAYIHVELGPVRAWLSVEKDEDRLFGRFLNCWSNPTNIRYPEALTRLLAAEPLDIVENAPFATDALDKVFYGKEVHQFRDFIEQQTEEQRIAIRSAFRDVRSAHEERTRCYKTARATLRGLHLSLAIEE